ncbi:MAG: Mov34/MPN/PAD-1 family protein [Bacteroidetes bacterium]|nr:Mov34/MPN/PAD-1 family protein [Bacteroidota bacterium]
MGKIKQGKILTPLDSVFYQISESVVSHTNLILKDYGRKVPPNEGLVYWAGTRKNNLIKISTVIAPTTESFPGRVSTTHTSNAKMIKILSFEGLVQIGQVHSHPSDWVDHSTGDNEWAPFKVLGLLSIVVPEYCQNGLTPLTMCGVHRFDKHGFIRLSNKYIEERFIITHDIKGNLFDLRS